VNPKYVAVIFEAAGGGAFLVLGLEKVLCHFDACYKFEMLVQPCRTLLPTFLHGVATIPLRFYKQLSIPGSQRYINPFR
jgi:hypothetical protein